MQNTLTKKINLTHVLVNKQKMIGIKFYTDKVIQSLIKTHFPEAKWHIPTNQVIIPNHSTNLNKVFQTFRGVAWVNTKYFYKKQKINEVGKLSLSTYKKRVTKHRKVPESFLEKLELKNYASNTARIYISMFERFINHYETMEIDHLNENNIRGYLKHIKQHEKRSIPYTHQMINAIKFYYEIVLDMPHQFYQLERPQKKEALPKVISKPQILAMINSTKNLKHKCILSLLYSAGLRRGELLQLKIEDIDSDRKLIRIEDSKGGKDRMTLLSDTVLMDLRSYYKKWKPTHYLFEGEKKGTQYSETSVAKIVTNAAKKTGIKKRVTPHTLRHSFATHLLEQGVDLRYIQTLLGHNSTKTTEIYTFVAQNSFKQIKNLLD
ncbi:MAG: site-specific tyrosine recombinase/integron integrase [Cyclobacteriaceae bacterium]